MGYSPYAKKRVYPRINDRQKRFAEEYLVDLNAEQAAIRAGYSPRGAASRATMLKQTPAVAAEIKRLQKERSERTNVTADRVVEELARMGFSNMMDYIRVQENGSAYVDLRALNRDQAAAIQEVTMEQVGEVMVDETMVPVRKIKFKLSDKKGPLELLGKHLGMFSDKLNVNLTGKVEVDNPIVAEQLERTLVELKALKEHVGGTDRNT